MKSKFNNIQLFTELAQPAILNLIDNGKVKIVSCSALSPDTKTLNKIYTETKRYQKYFILRPLEICNHPELIRRLGVIAINTPLEVDIYGNANSTHLIGSKMVNTIGGSGDFMRNAYLSIFTTPSTAKNKKITRIVPMVSHVDHTEHDWHVLITEHGVADLRGLSPRERADTIIKNCADPSYKPQLVDYLRCSIKKSGHTPHDFTKVFSCYTNLEKFGSMQM
jgi:succinyl-CoA:acetate CoA-transferase